VVFEVEFEVMDGPASVNPVFDFYFVDDAGVRSNLSGLTACDDPQLDDTFAVSTGGTRTGKIAFIVPSGQGGELFYRSEAEVLDGSWLVPSPA
jgi:hypothetical protein